MYDVTEDYLEDAESLSAEAFLAGINAHKDDADRNAIRKFRVRKAVTWRKESLAKKSDYVPIKDHTRTIALTHYVIALAAGVATTDAPSPREISQEISSFCEIFALPNPDDSLLNAYTQATQELLQPDHYAAQILNLFPDQYLVREQLLSNLLRFSDADSPLTSAKVVYLRQVAAALRFSEAFFKAQLRIHLIPVERNDPFVFLNVPRSISYVDLKKAYRHAVRDCHPDRLGAASGSNAIDPVLYDTYKDLFQYLTAAYNAIKQRKKFK